MPVAQRVSCVSGIKARKLARKSMRETLVASSKPEASGLHACYVYGSAQRYLSF